MTASCELSIQVNPLPDCATAKPKRSLAMMFDQGRGVRVRDDVLSPIRAEVTVRSDRATVRASGDQRLSLYVHSVPANAALKRPRAYENDFKVVATGLSVNETSRADAVRGHRHYGFLSAPISAVAPRRGGRLSIDSSVIDSIKSGIGSR